MTDNQLRAHQFALTCLSALISPAAIAAQAAEGKEAVEVDVFGIYSNVYDHSLNAFNEKFPKDK